MSESPMSPVGKRLRTMDNEQRTQDEFNSASLRFGQRDQSSQVNPGVIEHIVRDVQRVVDRNNSDPRIISQGTSTGLDVVGQQSASTHLEASARDMAPSLAPIVAGPASLPDDEQLRSMDRRRGEFFQTYREMWVNSNRDIGHHHEEVVDERIPARSREARPNQGRSRGRPGAQNERGEIGNRILVVNFYREGSADSDRSSVYRGVMRRAFNERDFDVEDDSFDMDSDDDDVAEAINHCSPEEYLKYDPTPDTPYPKPDWITFKELRARKYGFASAKQPTKRPNIYWFQKYASGSLWMIQRLQLERRLQSHTNCVNSLDFNSSADLLCSGSNDLTVCLWNWQKRTDHLRAKIDTGHASNVTQSVFCNSDTNIVTSSRDGTVRLLDIKTAQSSHLMSSSGEIGKLTFIEPKTFLTCGTNANVNLIDLRTSRASKLFTVRSPKNNRTCTLHSIDAHPLDKNMIAVAGSSPYVFLYDLRRLPRHSHDTEMKPKNCLGILENPNHIVTSTAFNSKGDKLLVSYNYDDLYVFKTDSCEVVHKYQGHRNKRTIKGCAWFGDNYVLSGSDDGHIYGWDLESEHIVCFLEGDRRVVNTLCVHPNLPILASSGIDHDVKIWEPISSTWPQTMKGIKPQICKNTLRRKRAYERRNIPVLDLDDDEDEDEYDEDDDDEDDDDEDEDFDHIDIDDRPDIEGEIVDYDGYSVESDENSDDDLMGGPRDSDHSSPPFARPPSNFLYAQAHRDYLRTRDHRNIDDYIDDDSDESSDGNRSCWNGTRDDREEWVTDHEEYYGDEEL